MIVDRKSVSRSSPWSKACEKGVDINYPCFDHVQNGRRSGREAHDDLICLVLELHMENGPAIMKRDGALNRKHCGIKSEWGRDSKRS